MSTLSEVGDRDGWRCWLCDEPVDPEASVNADRGPSVDSGAPSFGDGGGRGGGKKAKKPVAGAERLAHRACNTRKGAVRPVVPWDDALLVAEPAPLVAVVERLGRKGGREVVGRCPGRADGDAAAAWLRDRLGRLAPGLDLDADVEAGGGQFLLVVRAG